MTKQLNVKRLQTIFKHLHTHFTKNRKMKMVGNEVAQYKEIFRCTAQPACPEVAVNFYFVIVDRAFYFDFCFIYMFFVRGSFMQNPTRPPLDDRENPKRGSPIAHHLGADCRLRSARSAA